MKFIRWRSVSSVLRTLRTCRQFSLERAPGRMSFVAHRTMRCGQTFNLQTGSEPVASLDGLWRFHTGDNPTWADPNFDDSQWPLLRSDEDWGQQGYENYGGFAWYRFTIAVPEGSRNWSIYLGPMETGYQLFVDGRLAGSFGPILNSRNYAASSRVFAISPTAASGP